MGTGGRLRGSNQLKRAHTHAPLGLPQPICVLLGGNGFQAWDVVPSVLHATTPARQRLSLIGGGVHDWVGVPFCQNGESEQMGR